MADNILISSIYLGNAADIDTDEDTVGAEAAEDLLGTYGSATDPLSKSLVTLDTTSPSTELFRDDAPGGTEGTLTYDAGAGDVTTTLDTISEYSILVTFADGAQIKTSTTVIQTANGDLFLLADDFTSELGTDPIESITLLVVNRTDQTEIYQSDFDDVAFVCFTPGTLIDTPNGPRPVETLALGDLVNTRDHGPQPLRWIGKRTLHFDRDPHKQKPWRIKSGSMGDAQPSQDLILSPQHHILLTGDDVRALTGGSPQAIASIKSLARLRGVRQMNGKRRVTYFSLLFDQHQIIHANGLPVESFFPGPYGLSLLTPLQRLQIFVQFPRLHGDPENGYGPHVRPVLSGRQAAELAKSRRQPARCKKHKPRKAA